MSSLDDYVAALKTAFVTLGDKALYAALVTYVPFLGVWPISVGTQYAIDYVLKDVAKDGEIAAFFVYIDLRVDQQGRDFYAAVMLNHMAQQTGTPEEKANAEKELRDRFHQFARLTA